MKERFGTAHGLRAPADSERKPEFDREIGRPLLLLYLYVNVRCISPCSAVWRCGSRYLRLVRMSGYAVRQSVNRAFV